MADAAAGGAVIPAADATAMAFWEYLEKGIGWENLASVFNTYQETYEDYLTRRMLNRNVALPPPGPPPRVPALFHALRFITGQHVLSERVFVELYQPSYANYDPNAFRKFEIYSNTDATFLRINVDHSIMLNHVTHYSKIMAEILHAQHLPCYIYFDNEEEQSRLEIKDTCNTSVLDQLKHWWRLL